MHENSLAQQWREELKIGSMATWYRKNSCFFSRGILYSACRYRLLYLKYAGA